MLSEANAKRETDALEFKNQMFGLAFMMQNEGLYRKVYPEDFGMTLEEELAEIDWTIPESEEEALALFKEAMGETEEHNPYSGDRNLPLLVASP